MIHQPKVSVPKTVLAQVEELIRLAPLHEQVMGKGPHGLRMKERIVGARSAEQSGETLLATKSLNYYILKAPA